MGGWGLLACSGLSQGLLLGQRPPKVHIWASVEQAMCSWILEPWSWDTEPQEKGQSLGLGYPRTRP